MGTGNTSTKASVTASRLSQHKGHLVVTVISKSCSQQRDLSQSTVLGRNSGKTGGAVWVQDGVSYVNQPHSIQHRPRHIVGTQQMVAIITIIATVCIITDNIQTRQPIIYHCYSIKTFRDPSDLNNWVNSMRVKYVVPSYKARVIKN